MRTSSRLSVQTNKLSRVANTWRSCAHSAVALNWGWDTRAILVLWTSRNHVRNHLGSQKPHKSTRFCGGTCEFTVTGTNVGRRRWISPPVVEPDSRTEPINSHYSGLILPMNAPAASRMRRHRRQRFRAIRRRGGTCRPQRRRRRRRMFPPPAPNARRLSILAMLSWSRHDVRR